MSYKQAKIRGERKKGLFLPFFSFSSSYFFSRWYFVVYSPIVFFLCVCVYCCGTATKTVSNSKRDNNTNKNGKKKRPLPSCLLRLHALLLLVVNQGGGVRERSVDAHGVTDTCTGLCFADAESCCFTSAFLFVKLRSSCCFPLFSHCAMRMVNGVRQRDKVITRTVWVRSRKRYGLFFFTLVLAQERPFTPSFLLPLKTFRI